MRPDVLLVHAFTVKKHSYRFSGHNSKPKGRTLISSSLKTPPKVQSSLFSKISKMSPYIGNLVSLNPHGIGLRCSNLKRSRCNSDNLRRLPLARKVSDEREVILKTQVDQVVSSSQVAKKKSRQSFCMSTKISWVKDYQSCPPGTNMRRWLEEKNARDGTKVSYTSFRRWVVNLQSMTRSDLETYFPVYSRKNFTRPLNEMEEVLVKFLSVRNFRLHASGKRKSTPCYIRAKAKEFFDEMYGDDSSIDFKASNGWLDRFQNSFKHLLDPELLHKNPKHLTSNQGASKEKLSTPSSMNIVTMGKADTVLDDHSLTKKDIEFLQGLMSDLSNY